MGKRKAKRKPMKKSKEKLDTEFNCLFCGQESSVTCKMDKDKNRGILNCRSCGVSFEKVLNDLDLPVDVYTNWIDSTEAAQNDEVPNKRQRRD
ncbi:hypothetical protein SeLEV6574_g01299 [Synchytrium endobioticum]|nr:hypothetical protein SeLEV6574_g01299 [Synchytrium endobioticum]